VLYLSNQTLDFYYRENQIISMKLLASVIFVISLIGLTSCVEEEGENGSAQDKPRNGKFLIPTEAQSSRQMEQHKSSDKMLASSKKANNAKKAREEPQSNSPGRY